MWEELKRQGLVSDKCIAEEDDFRDQLYALAFFAVNKFGYSLDEALEADFITLYEAFHIYKRLIDSEEEDDD